MLARGVNGNPSAAVVPAAAPRRAPALARPMLPPVAATPTEHLEARSDGVTDDARDPDAALAGRWYADTFQVGHNAFEFKLDCGHDAEGEVTTVYFRVLTNPSSARELFRLLGAALLQYADAFGPIGDRGRPAAPRRPT